MTDSPRWCEIHYAYGDHHTDRCPGQSIGADWDIDQIQILKDLAEYHFPNNDPNAIVMRVVQTTRVNADMDRAEMLDHVVNAKHAIDYQRTGGKRG